MSLLNGKYFRNFYILQNSFQRCYSKFVSDVEIKKSYHILGIPEDSDQEKIRSAYLSLVKKYHPDSGLPEANSEKFHEIDKAFRILLTKKSKERWSADEVNFEVHAEVFDIKHTAPQHRQFLNYDGYGIGSPFQREKQYGKIRAMQAADNILNHRMNKINPDENALLTKKPLKHKIKTKYGIERLVEDLIQESMSKGEFDNLAGKGKPLKNLQNFNPYLDTVTHKLNQVLIENGFTPEWILLQKEIREERANLYKTLNERRNKLGEYPLDIGDAYRWNCFLEEIQDTVKDINNKIEKYNLVVPILEKQIIPINLKKEAEKIAKFGETKQIISKREMKHIEEAKDKVNNVVKFIKCFYIK